MKKLLLTLAVTTILSACSDQSETSSAYDNDGVPSKGGMIVSASIGEPTNLVPFLSTDSASSDVSGMIYSGLLTYDKDLNIEGDLAESWEISEDGLTITFRIRKDVQWEDGTPLTTADIMATFNAIRDPNTRTAYAGDYQLVTSAEAIDDYTFRVSYDKPFAPALSSWVGLKILPAHILELDDDINESRLIKEPMGTGPYTLYKWEGAQEVELKANPTYYKGEPNITIRRTRLIPDLDTQFLELKAGRIDTMGLKPVQFTRLTDQPAFQEKYNKYKYLGFNYTYMGFKLDNPLFSSKAVRQALSYATPREQIISGVLMGQGLPINAPFKPGTWAYNENLTSFDYDPQKAKDMLADEGWSDSDGNGILDKDGQEFAFTVVTNQGNDQRIKSAEIIQAAFKDIGVKMEINVQEWSTFIENTIHAKNFEAFILGWSLTPEPDPFDIWHSSKTGPKEFNVIGFNNPEADDMMELARGTFNQSERKKYLDRFQEIVNDEQPYLFLYAPYSLVAMHKRIKGIEPAPAGLGHNTEEWYIPEEQRVYKEVMNK